MKGSILIFLLFPFFCLAQESKTSVAAKPSTIDCPTWKKSKKVSKADYFQSLRTTQKSGTQATYNTNPKIQPNSDPQKAKKSSRNEKVKQSEEEKSTVELSVKPKKEEKSTVDVIAKSNASGSSKTEPTKSTKSEKSSTAKVESPVVLNDSSEKEKSVTVAATSQEGAKAEPDGKEKVESTKLKRKLERMAKKKTKVRKHSNSKCPSF
ncbi:MAG: hypothetical protein V4608_06365 [Bacteroidota bacterium]